MKITAENPTEIIAEARPNIKPNTIKQYEANLKKLKQLFDSDTYDFLDNPSEVETKIGHLHFTSRRNHYNAIIVLLMALNHDEKYNKLIEKYGEMRDELNDEYNKQQQSGVISDKQSKNFATMEEVNEMIDKMGSELKIMKLRNKEQLTSKEKALLQVYTIFNIYAKMPLRNDIAGMETIRKGKFNKLSEEDQKEKNWLLIEKNKLSFVLNNYKSNKTYGQKIIEIEDKDLRRLLRYYMKINGEGVLFKSSTGKALTRNALSQLLLKWSKKYMDKSISTTLLRKIYLSSKYGDMKEELEKDNNIMGHSKAVAMNTYIKKAQDE